MNRLNRPPTKSTQLALKRDLDLRTDRVFVCLAVVDDAQGEGNHQAVPRVTTPTTGQVTSAVDSSPTAPFTAVHSVTRTVPE